MAILGIRFQASSIPPIEDSLALYLEWNAKLAKSCRAEIDAYPPWNGEMHDLRYWFQRPSSGGVHGMHYGFDTDGRRSRSDCDAYGDFDRPTERDDLKKYLKLPGFESFYAPKAKVLGRGPLRIVRTYQGRKIVADLRIDGEDLTLYFDPITRMLYSCGPFRAEALDLYSMNFYYFSIKITPKKQVLLAPMSS